MLCRFVSFFRGLFVLFFARLGAFRLVFLLLFSCPLSQIRMSLACSHTAAFPPCKKKENPPLLQYKCLPCSARSHGFKSPSVSPLACLCCLSFVCLLPHPGGRAPPLSLLLPQSARLVRPESAGGIKNTRSVQTSRECWIPGALPPPTTIQSLPPTVTPLLGFCLSPSPKAGGLHHPPPPLSHNPLLTPYFVPPRADRRAGAAFLALAWGALFLALAGAAFFVAAGLVVACFDLLFVFFGGWMRGGWVWLDKLLRDCTYMTMVGRSA